jgi:hypothetical protein
MNLIFIEKRSNLHNLKCFINIKETTSEDRFSAVKNFNTAVIKIHKTRSSTRKTEEIINLSSTESIAD